MGSLSISRWALALPIVPIALIAMLQLWSPIPVQTLRHTVFDQYQRWHPRPTHGDPVRIVDIDEESLARRGQWPWPRTLLADLVHRLQAAGAAAIAFDIVFAEPDRANPRLLSRQWTLSPGLAAQLAALPDPDAEFAASLRGAPVVLGYMLADSGPPPPTLETPFRIVTVGESATRRLPGAPSAVLPLAPLRQAAAGLGTISFTPDADGVIRRVPMLQKLGDQIAPSLVAEALRLAQGSPRYLLSALPNDLGLASVQIGAYRVPVTPTGEAWLYYSAPRPQRYLPAWQVLDGQLNDPSLRGAIVLIGTSAKGLMDLRFNPLGTPIPGVEAHAQLIEQIRNGQPLNRPAWAEALELLAIIVGGALVAGVALSGGPMRSAAFALLLAAAFGTASWFAFHQHALLLDPAMPALALLACYLTGGITRHMAAEQRQRWVRNAFSRYVSPNLVSHLIENPEQLVLSGRRQTCSFIFTDLADFTALMERIDPALAVSSLNAYLDGMIEIVFRHEGTLDRIIGDALAVVFSAPIEQPDHMRRAHACALDLHRFASDYVAQLKARGTDFGETRIGVHAGEVIVGNFGGSTLFDYRALGDAVNVASRLEGLNKHLGTSICVSDEIRHACPEMPMRPIGRVVLKGRTQALLVYEPLLDAQGQPAAGPDLEYQAAYDLLAGHDAAAINAFRRLAARRPADALVQFQDKRLREGDRDDLIVMLEK
ncbi:MAG: adenylate/guanylate cyclase domain-containing protein [Burkholderiales bacterium]|nr:adenylate/guanylate cyclase domain-containing protein [Burkholderiales bacterium]